MANQIDKFILKLPPNRQLLCHLLMDKDWFKKSDFQVQKEVLSLPNEFEGFVYDLAQRQDRIGNVNIQKLVKINRGVYLITPQFLVYSPKTKKTFTREYVSWSLGKNPGVKGILLVKTENRISHFITVETEKFPIGKSTFDAIGGLSMYNPNQIIGLLSKQIENTINKKMGLTSLKIDEIYDLGRLETDNGLTPNHPGIFAAVIDGNQAQKIAIPDQTTSKSGLFTINIIPIEQLEMYISKIDDAFFLSTICRLLAKGVITL